jgi:hypothetical protein
MGRTWEQWDRVHTVMAMASEDGNRPTYADDSACRDCGSEFMQHRCHMEEDS